MFGGTVAKIRAKMFIRRLLNWVYVFCRFIFRTLEVILRRFEVRLQRYTLKSLFAVFEIGFTAIAVLFLEHWWFFCFYSRYSCKDTSENFFHVS